MVPVFSYDPLLNFDFEKILNYRKGGIEIHQLNMTDNKQWKLLRMEILNEFPHFSTKTKGKGL